MPFVMPRWGWIALAGLALVLAFYGALTAYGHARYKAGEQHADEAWKAASDKLIQQAANSAGKADATKAIRDADFAARQEDEQKKIAQAEAEGNSPYDVLFGASK
jgi:hypothetical protein